MAYNNDNKGGIFDQVASMLPKRDKRSRSQMLLELSADLADLEKDYTYIFNRQRRISQGRTNSRGVRNRAKNKAEIAFCCLCVVHQAQDNLYEMISDEALSKAMNNMGKALKLMNRLSGSSEEVRVRFINKQIKKMNNYADEANGGLTAEEMLSEGTQDSIDEWLGRDWRMVVQNLFNGECTLEESVAQGIDALEDSKVLDDMDSMLESISEENLSPEEPKLDRKADVPYQRVMGMSDAQKELNSEFNEFMDL